MADRVSSRRALANSFFLTINLAILGLLTPAIGAVSSERRFWFTVVIVLTLLAECGIWLSMMRSYRILNKAKYQVIGVLEEKLPAFAYSRGEWKSYVRAGKFGKYFGLTRVEQVTPVLFAFAYLGILIAVFG
jgi:hypothetical protein